MKILVANLGSTSFKYRLFDMADERVLARGGVERIGSRESHCFVESGGKISQETRLFDPGRGETRSLRSKEDAHDYRYFPDPDLLPLVLTQDYVERIKASLP